jgi:predicted HNH restriction endonuclease
MEGDKKIGIHSRRERESGLPAAKKDEFRRLNSDKLFCERCGLDPVAIFGTADGEACIEVHHHVVQVKDMDEGHISNLADLRCLCANCHRFVHRLLRNELNLLKADSKQSSWVCESVHE